MKLLNASSYSCGLTSLPGIGGISSPLLANSLATDSRVSRSFELLMYSLISPVLISLRVDHTLERPEYRAIQSIQMGRLISLMLPLDRNSHHRSWESQYSIFLLPFTRVRTRPDRDKVDQGILRPPNRKAYGLRHLRRMPAVMRQKIDQTFGPRPHPKKRPQLKPEGAVGGNRHLTRQAASLNFRPIKPTGKESGIRIR